MTEVPGGQDFERKVLEVMTKNPKGVTMKNFEDSLPSMNTQNLVDFLNKLLGQHKVQLLRRGNQLVYKLKDASSNQHYQGTDVEEKVVFEAVGKAGNNGIMARDLKRQCNLSQPVINKILKALENKRLVKCITSTSRKKLFMLYDLEPSQTITGGTFYSGQEFEAEFVNVLGDQCYRYLVKTKAVAEQELSDPISQKNASYKSSRDICEYINNLKISKVKLSLKDVENILESLIYEDKIEKSVSITKTSSKDAGIESLYRVVKPLSGSMGLMMVPCGVCTVYKDCHTEGDISPATCVYMQQWLDF